MVRDWTFLLALVLVFNCPGKAQGAPSGEKPVSATVINKNPDYAAAKGWETGDIQVTLANGKTKVLTHGERCRLPKVSRHGDVGWAVWDDYLPDNRYYHSSEQLRVLRHDGTISDFRPNALFIEDWTFVDNDSAVVIASRHHHGPQYFIKYDLQTWRILGAVDGYKDYDKLPAWAQPFSDDKPNGLPPKQPEKPAPTLRFYQN